MIKIAFFDVDGTLLSHSTNTIPESTISGLKELKNKGIKIVVCTGRNPIEFKEIKPLQGIDFDGYIYMGGALSYCEEKVVSAYPVAKEDLQAIYHFQKEKKVSMLAVEKDTQYINLINDYTKSALAAVHIAHPPIGNFDQILIHDIYQFVFFPTKNELEELNALLKNVLITSWNPYGYDLVHKDSGKGNAVKDVCKYYNIDLKDSLAFGDGENDIEMIETAGISVAMGNGISKLKEASDYVTADIDEDGLYLALKHYQIL